MKKIHLIVNPAAGRGAGARAVKEIESLLAAAGADCLFSFTSGGGDGIALAAKTLEHDVELVVAVGGDGTINEVVNGLQGRPIPLGIIPVGSGNDFIKVLGIPEDLRGAVHTLLHGVLRTVDMGEVNGRLFVNSLALGIDGAVAGTMNRAILLPPRLAYHYGVLFNVLFFRNVGIVWHSDEESGSLRVNLASVMNGSTYGGSYRVAPGALVDDGLLDLVIVGDYGIVGRVRHLPKVKKGTHFGLSRVLHRRVKALEIRVDRAIPLALDGELVDAGMPDSTLRIAVRHRALSVMVPAGGGQRIGN